MSDAAPMRVLIVDDERNIRKTLSIVLQGLGCEVTETGSADAAVEALERSPFDLALVDRRLGSDDGLALLPRLLAGRPGLEVVMITAYAAVDTAVEAIRRGAKDYVRKPFTPAQIRRAVEQARERRALALRLADLEERLADAAPEPSLDALSAPMRGLMEIISKAAAHDVPVLLRGENGTGKTVLARTLHELGPRKGHPFAVVNCPARTGELLPSELFGHAQGAFTGAMRDQPARVEAADAGPLVLAETDQLPPPLHANPLPLPHD